MARVGGRTTLIVCALAVLTAGVAAGVWFGTRPAPTPPAPAPAPVAAPAPKPVGEKPHWEDLKPAQRQALAPLKDSWEELGPVRKQKWISIANRLARMPADEKARVQQRMREWVALSPTERKAVRENYARAQKITPRAAQKAAEWEQYQQLPEDAKRKLAEAASAKKPQIAKPPTPAQAAVQTPPAIKAHGQGLVPPAGTVPPGTLPPPVPAAPPESAPAPAAPAPQSDPVTTTAAAPAAPTAAPNASK